MVSWEGVKVSPGAVGEVVGASLVWVGERVLPVGLFVGLRVGRKVGGVVTSVGE